MTLPGCPFTQMIRLSDYLLAIHIKLVWHVKARLLISSEADSLPLPPILSDRNLVVLLSPAFKRGPVAGKPRFA